MRKLIFATLLILSLSQCSSPLSDTPVSDPMLITPTILLQHIDDDYGMSNKASACLTDKNGAYIELMQGKVEVQGDRMEFAMTCYVRTIEIKPQNSYNVTITLADSTEYPCNITTPAYFKKVKFPEKISLDSSFDISWKTKSEGDTKINFSVQDSTKNWITIFEEFTTENSINISPDNYPKGDINNGIITLTKTTSGDMPSGFNGGSIAAQCIFQRTIKINQ